MALHDVRLAFGMEGDKIHRNCLSIGEALTTLHMLKEAVQELQCSGTSWARTGRPANARCRKPGTYAGDRVVIQLVVVLWRRVPIANIRLVPNLEIPLLHSLAAVAFNQMVRNHADEFT